jgi:hypothetical protein
MTRSMRRTRACRYRCLRRLRRLTLGADARRRRPWLYRARNEPVSDGGLALGGAFIVRLIRSGSTVRSCDVPLPSWVNNRDVELRVQGALKGAAHTARRRPFRRVVEVWFSDPPSAGRVQTAVEAAGPSWRVVVRMGPDPRPPQSVSAVRRPGSDGGAGVREPRRPRPPSGSGHLQIGG